MGLCGLKRWRKGGKGKRIECGREEGLLTIMMTNAKSDSPSRVNEFLGTGPLEIVYPQLSATHLINATPTPPLHPGKLSKVSRASY